MRCGSLRHGMAGALPLPGGAAGCAGRLCGARAWGAGDAWMVRGRRPGCSAASTAATALRTRRRAFFAPELPGELRVGRPGAVPVLRPTTARTRSRCGWSRPRASPRARGPLARRNLPRTRCRCPKSANEFQTCAERRRQRPPPQPEAPAAPAVHAAVLAAAACRPACMHGLGQPTVPGPPPSCSGARPPGSNPAHPRQRCLACWGGGPFKMSVGGGGGRGALSPPGLKSAPNCLVFRVSCFGGRSPGINRGRQALTGRGPSFHLRPGAFWAFSYHCRDQLLEHRVQRQPVQPRGRPSRAEPGR